MQKRAAAREIESMAVTEGPLRRRAFAQSANEALAMLVRRGFHPVESDPDLPFPGDLDSGTADRLSDLLSHYAFRLFLRGAIGKREGFSPKEATRYLTAAQSRAYAAAMVDLGLAERSPRGRYRLLRPTPSFGGTLEWYVARELQRRFAFSVASCVKLQVRGVGGDFDIVAAAEGRLIYLELKSSPPKNLSAAEITAFFDRLELLRPDIGLFVVDTALRLSDKILPMLRAEIRRRRGEEPAAPRRIEGELWAFSQHLLAVNGRRDLMANIGHAIAAGMRALAPEPF
jgi:hypothetical protein